MAKAAKKNQADLREPVAAQQGELDALRAKVEGTPEGGKAPPEAPDEPRSQYENDDQSELATLRARLAELEAKEKGVVAPIEIDIEALKSVAMTEKDAQQTIEQTKRVRINVVDEITLKDVTPKNQRITVPAPTNLGEGLLVVIDLFNKHGRKIITLAYDVRTNAQGLYLELRNAASQKKFRQQEE
jgi:hypothetical protein